ncbi:MAG TPA: tyrosine-type recombinase/integrase [Kofleriaceae bacterium]|nr:tyrosine-type recombinase/integrase [Kofleriaceae bacterium]
MAIDAYLDHARERGVRDGSVATIGYRLRAMLRTDENDRLLRTLTPAVASELYAKRSAETKADTHRGELAEASRFAAWCVKRGWFGANPFAEIEPTGRCSRGKPQLRVDEARRFLATALAENSDSGLAAAMALLMAMRASEITDRVARDVDDGGRILWIERAKTRAGDRQLEIPEVLRARLLALANNRAPDEKLFGNVDRHWVGYHVRRLCKAAKVPIVPPHGLRGTHSSISAQVVPVDHVARALGHAGADVTRQHYLAPGAEASGKQRIVLKALAGGLTSVPGPIFNSGNSTLESVTKTGSGKR